MHFEIEVEEQGRGVLVRCTGVVTGDGLAAANTEMYGAVPDGEFEYQVWDLTGADSVAVSSEELRNLAMQDAAETSEQPGHLVAIVGDPDYLMGADELYTIYAEVWSDVQSKSFKTVDEARVWIESNRND